MPGRAVGLRGRRPRRARVTERLAGGKLRLDRPAPHVARLTIDNPAKRNALDHAILDAIARTARELDDARCLILTAERPGVQRRLRHRRPAQGRVRPPGRVARRPPLPRRHRDARGVPLSRRGRTQRPRHRRRARAGADLRPAPGRHRRQARHAAGQARPRLLAHRPAQVHRRHRRGPHARAVLHRPQRQRRDRAGMGPGHGDRRRREARRARPRLRDGDRRPTRRSRWPATSA